MILKRYSLVMFLLLCGGCVMEENHKEPGNLDVWMLKAFDACIEAQLAINNPLLDVQTKKPRNGVISDYQVEFTRIPELPVYHVSISLVKPYPGSFSFSCRLDSKTHTVLQAAYYQGEPDSGKNKVVNIIDHNPLEGIAVDELNSLVREGKTANVPLSKFYE